MVHIVSYLMHKYYCIGPRVDLVGTSKLPYGQIPVLLHNGEITLQTQSGKLASFALDTHSYLFIDAIEGKSLKEVLYCCFWKWTQERIFTIYINFIILIT